MREDEHHDERVVHEAPPREVVHEHREVREQPVYHEEPVDRPVVRDAGPSLTGFALVKYGFVLIMVVIILYFIARFVLPLLP